MSSSRPIVALVLLSLAALAPAGGGAQSVSWVAVAPFVFDPPVGFVAAPGATQRGVLLRDAEGNELTAEAYPGPHPLAALPPPDVAATLGNTLQATLAPAGFAWLVAPEANRRADGVTIFRALAARPLQAGNSAFQFVVYAITADATLHVGYAGVGREVAARAALDTVVRSLRTRPEKGAF